MQYLSAAVLMPHVIFISRYHVVHQRNLHYQVSPLTTSPGCQRNCSGKEAQQVHICNWGIGRILLLSFTSPYTLTTHLHYIFQLLAPHIYRRLGAVDTRRYLIIWANLIDLISIIAPPPRLHLSQPSQVTSILHSSTSAP